MTGGRKRRISSFKREYHRHKSHIQDIHNRARHLTNETVESTRRIKSLVHKSQSAGVKTAVKLGDHDERLTWSESHLDEIHSSLTSANKDLRKVDLGWRYYLCYICCCCYKCHKDEHHARHHHHLHSHAAVLTQNPNIQRKVQRSESALKILYQKGGSKHGEAGKAGMVVRIQNNAQENEMHKNLHETSSMIGSLKSIASDLEATLTKSNKQLDRLKEKTENQQSHLDKAKNKTTELLKK